MPELGRSCFEAFKGVHEKHGFTTDFPTVEFAQRVVGLLVQREDVYGIAAFDGDSPKGYTFLSLWDDVAGVGPVSVDVAAQGKGIGRRLMEDVIAYAGKQGFEMVRLCQDSFNSQSLALYASLRFDAKEPLGFLDLSDSSPVDPAFRTATADDLPAMDDLCRSVYRITRKEESAGLMQLGFPAFVLDRGHVAGYLLGTPVGHGVAETDDDMIALLAGMGATTPGATALVPLRNGELYRRALAAGHSNRKVMILMALGPYEQPQGTYCPSVNF